MKRGICPGCSKLKLLGRHSKIGNHKPPFVYLCRKCHDRKDGMNPPRKKNNKKYARGTPHQHKKKKFK